MKKIVQSMTNHITTLQKNCKKYSQLPAKMTESGFMAFNQHKYINNIYKALLL